MCGLPLLASVLRYGRSALVTVYASSSCRASHIVDNSLPFVGSEGRTASGLCLVTRQEDLAALGASHAASRRHFVLMM